MMGPPDHDLLDLLYSAPLEPALWVSFMERFADRIGGAQASLSQFDVVSGSGPRLAARVDPENIPIYNAHYSNINPLNNVSDPADYVNNWSLKTLTDEDWMPKEALVSTEFYNGFFRRQNIHSVLMIRLALRGNAPCVLNICRPPGSEQFGGGDRAFAEHYQPHLVRAFVLSERLAGERRLGAGISEGLESASLGVIVLDQRGAVRHVNPLAERIFQAQGGLAVREGRLTSGDADVARALQALIGAAGSADPERRSGGAMRLRMPDGHSLSLTVTPIRPAYLAFFDGDPAVLLTIAGLAAPAGPTPETLREAFGLTRTESRVALALAEGLEPRKIAARHGVSLNTVRVQIAAVFNKTRSHRQVELIQRLNRLR